MEWYEQPYFQHRDWIISHLEYLGLSDKEALLVLILDFFNEHGEFINLNHLGLKLHLQEEEIETLLNQLINKGYLNITSTNMGPHFDLQGLFLYDQKKISQDDMDSSLFSIFDQNFNRPLSSTELQKLVEWHKAYDDKVIIWALREALINDKINFSYIEACILSAYKNDEKLHAILEDRQ